MGKLPIEGLTTQEFDVFKKKYLDSLQLTSEALNQLEKLFAVGREDTGHILCDDYHVHTFKCNFYIEPTVGVVDRLIGEIRVYREVVKDLQAYIQSERITMPYKLKAFLAAFDPKD